jgi:hypothetical protein
VAIQGFVRRTFRILRFGNDFIPRFARLASKTTINQSHLSLPHFLKLRLNSAQALLCEVRSHQTQKIRPSLLLSSNLYYILHLHSSSSTRAATSYGQILFTSLKARAVLTRTSLALYHLPQNQLSTTSILLIFIFNLRLRCASPFRYVWISWKLR